MKPRHAVAGSLAILLLVGCGGDDGDGPDLADAQGTSADAPDDGDTPDDGEGPDDRPEIPDLRDDDESEPDETVPGGRENPLPPGTVVVLGDWSLTLHGVTLDATDAVLSENPFNDEPGEGRQFVMLDVEATYEGDGSGDAWRELEWAIEAADGATFRGTSVEDYCGVIPGPLDGQRPIAAGDTVGGNVCISAESDLLDGATIRVEEAVYFDASGASFSLS